MRPKLTIKRGKLLEPFFKVFIEQKYPDFAFPSDDMVNEKIMLFKQEWAKYEDAFFDGLEKIGLEFTRNHIEVFVIAATDRDMSAPLVIRSRYDEKEFISVLLHELLHNLFNDIGLIKGYEEETDSTRSHVYVFAVEEYLFRDVLNEPERLEVEKSKSNSEKNVEYYKAWQIVERDGYRNIVQGIRKSK